MTCLLQLVCDQSIRILSVVRLDFGDMERALRRGIGEGERAELWMELFLRATLPMGIRIELQWCYMSTPDVKNTNWGEAEVVGGWLADVSLMKGARFVFRGYGLELPHTLARNSKQGLTTWAKIALGDVSR